MRRCEGPVAWLYTRSLIGDRERLAAARFQADWNAAETDGRPHPWEPKVDGGPVPPGQTAMMRRVAAMGRIEDALRAVGPELRSPLVAAVLQERGLEQIEKRHGWPPRCGKVVVTLALQILARHYGS